MRNVILILFLEAIVLACACGFLYQKNPAGCMHVVDDVRQLVTSAISGTNAAPIVPEGPTPAYTPPPTPVPVVAPTPTPAPAPITPSPAPPAAWTPSAPTPPAAPVPAPTASAPTSPLPSQPNWTWTTIAGRVYANVKVLSVDPNSVMIMYDGGAERVPLAYLPPDLQKLFNYTPPAGSAPNATAASAPSAIVSMVSGNLVRYTNNGLQPVSDATLAPVRYIAIYYSAQWCPPCHAFTPKLVQFYNSFKPAHPDFDLIFVSEDHDENQMHDYMQEMAMPWPAVSYDKLLHPAGTFKGTGIEGFANSGIPDLVLVDSTGKVLSDSFHGAEYVGPDAVVADIQSMVK